MGKRILSSLRKTTNSEYTQSISERAIQAIGAVNVCISDELSSKGEASGVFQDKMEKAAKRAIEYFKEQKTSTLVLMQRDDLQDIPVTVPFEVLMSEMIKGQLTEEINKALTSRASKALTIPGSYGFIDEFACFQCEEDINQFSVQVCEKLKTIQSVRVYICLNRQFNVELMGLEGAPVDYSYLKSQIQKMQTEEVSKVSSLKRKTFTLWITLSRSLIEKI